MRWFNLFPLCSVAAGALLAWHGSGLLLAQDPAGRKGAAIVDVKGLPARAAAIDYQGHGQAGMVTIGADFTGHDVGTQDGILSNEDYIVIEAGLFGPPGARLTLALEDFSLRINGKKATPRVPYELVVKSTKDPDYEPPVPAEKGSKTMMTGTGSKQDGVDPNAPPPIPIPIPFEVKHGWELRVKRDSLQFGDRALPQAGLMFFSYPGRAKDVHTLELVYSGPAGKASVAIHP